MLPSEIKPSLEDSNRRRLDNFPEEVRLGTSQAVLREDSFQLETVVSARKHQMQFLFSMKLFSQKINIPVQDLKVEKQKTNIKKNIFFRNRRTELGSEIQKTFSKNVKVTCPGVG